MCTPPRSSDQFAPNPVVLLKSSSTVFPGEGLGEIDPEGEKLADGDLEGLTELETLLEELSDGDTEELTEGDTEGLTDGETLLEEVKELGEALELGLIERDAEGLFEGLTEGLLLEETLLERLILGELLAEVLAETNIVQAPQSSIVSQGVGLALKISMNV